MTPDQVDQLLELLEKGGAAAALLFALHIVVTPAAWLAAVYFVAQTVRPLFESLRFAHFATSEILRIKTHVAPADDYQNLVCGDQQRQVAEFIDRAIAEDAARRDAAKGGE